MSANGVYLLAGLVQCFALLAGVDAKVTGAYLMIVGFVMFFTLGSR